MKGCTAWPPKHLGTEGNFKVNVFGWSLRIGEPGKISGCSNN
jgi:hypothetical protein